MKLKLRKCCRYSVEKMKPFLIMVLFSLICFSSSVAQDLTSKRFISLFSDKKAFNQGDIVTILLMEFTSGSNEATTNSKFENQMELSSSGAGSMDFIPGLGFSGGLSSDQKSNGGTTRQGSLKGKVSAQIIDELPNGLLKIEGQRSMIVNGEEQITLLSGFIRPNDISATNTVYSYLIADASITYLGKGIVKDAISPGLISRFFGWLF